MDVLELPGWRHEQIMKAMDVVDNASSYQVVEPIANETASELRRAYVQKWRYTFGSPDEVRMDAQRSNTSASPLELFEGASVSVTVIPAEAHWQLGKWRGTKSDTNTGSGNHSSCGTY